MGLATHSDSLLLQHRFVHDRMVMYSGGVQPNMVKFGEVAVHSAGSGPPVVLLHANGGSHHDFDALIESLAMHASVYAVDWPGHGDSGTGAEPGACAFADLLPPILEGLGRGPYTLVGNSVGGFAAIRTAARHPHLVRNLVLVNPGGFTPRWPTTFIACRLFGWERFAPIAMRLLPRLYLRRRTQASTKSEGLRLSPRDPRRRPGLSPRYGGVLRTRTTTRCRMPREWKFLCFSCGVRVIQSFRG